MYQWDLRMNKCLSKTADEGNFSTTAIAVSKDFRSFATASKMGTVNMFDIDPETQTLVSKPKK